MGRDPAETHRIEITYKDGDAVRYIEERGLDRVDISLENKIDSPLPLKNRDELVAAARADLQAAGEQTDLDIIEAALKSLPNDRGGAIYTALRAWIDEINVRRTLLSRLRRAAQFLTAWHMLSVNLRQEYSVKEGASENAARGKIAATQMDSACFFADAWYYWRREVDGTHAIACSGLQVTASLAKGSEEKSRQAREGRQRIVLDEYGSDIDGKLKCADIAKDKMRLERVNYALMTADEDPFLKRDRAHKPIMKDGKTAASRDALTRYLQRIRRDRKQPR
jgi:hypothetical protein